MPIDKHHVVYVSQGGAEGDVVEMCHLCHVQLHSDRNDFREWGRIGGKKTQATKPNWQRNLKQYREHRHVENAV
jgi:hypothetical protein